MLLRFLKIKEKNKSRTEIAITIMRRIVLSRLNNKKPQSPIHSIKQSGLFSNMFIGQKLISSRRGNAERSPWG